MTAPQPLPGGLRGPYYPREQVSAGVLAGGRGSRLGGVDKGLLPLDGQPLVAHVLAALRPQAGCLLVNANRNQAAYGRLGVPVLADRRPGFAGPLAGMDALLAACDTDWLLVVPCDGPAVAPDLGPRLWAAAVQQQADAAVAAIQGRQQPVHVLLHRRLQPRLQADLAAGSQAAGRWLRAQRLAVVDFSDRAACFANVNTPRQRAALVPPPQGPG